MTSRKDKRILPLFLLHPSNDQLSQKTFKLRALFHFSVNIEAYVSPKKAMQCFKCQKFFHHAILCFLDPRCVRCSEAHDSYSWSRKNATNTENDTKPNCSNCLEEHPDSYRGCKKFKNKIPQNLMLTQCKIKITPLMPLKKK